MMKRLKSIKAAALGIGKERFVRLETKRQVSLTRSTSHL